MKKIVNRELFQRICFYAVPVSLFVLYFHFKSFFFAPVLLTSVLVVFCGGACNELYLLISKSGNRCNKTHVIFSILPLLLAVLFRVNVCENSVVYFAYYSFLVSLLCVVFLSKKRKLVDAIALFFSWIYIGFPFAFVYLVATSHIKEANQILLFFFVVVKGSDVAGYVFGRLLKGWKLAPKISPNKTISGSISAFIFAYIVSYAFYIYSEVNSPLLFRSLSQAIALGLILSFLGQAGDLLESYLKRRAGVKDSGSIPGVGGILDSVDSLLLATPFIYLYIGIT